MSREDLRRTLHACSAAILIVPAVFSWPAFRWLTLFATPLVLLLEFVRLRNTSAARLAQAAIPAFRAQEWTRISGAVWLWLGYATAVWFPGSMAHGGILAGALVDPAASLAGTRWGRGQRKSWIGTAAASAVGAGVLAASGTPFGIALGGGLWAAALERWSGPVNDNLIIAPGVAAFLWLLS